MRACEGAYIPNARLNVHPSTQHGQGLHFSCPPGEDWALHFLQKILKILLRCKLHQPIENNKKQEGFCPSCYWFISRTHFRRTHKRELRKPPRL